MPLNMSSDDQQPALNTGPLPSRYTSNHPIRGIHVTLHPMTLAHADSLYASLGGPDNAHLWYWTKRGPFFDIASFRATIQDYLKAVPSQERALYTIVLNSTACAVGFCALCDIDLVNAKCEFGPVVFGQSLQRTRAGTEVQYLMTRVVFEELGFRRYEWSCDAANVASKRAAERFGFVFEGCRRQELVVKGSVRDRCWYSILAGEWGVVKRAYEEWLGDGNFDEVGGQRRGLVEIREGLMGRGSYC